MSSKSLIVLNLTILLAMLCPRYSFKSEAMEILITVRVSIPESQLIYFLPDLPNAFSSICASTGILGLLAAIHGAYVLRIYSQCCKRYSKIL